MTAVRKELRRRRKPLWFATAFVALAAVLVFAFVASAGPLPGSTFEGDDGNFVPTGTNTDWTNVHGGVTKGVDLATGQTDNSFGNGTKESDVNVTVGTGSIPNSKADLGNFYVASELANNEVFMYLGWTRVNTSGTTNFDFEINQAAQPDLTTPGPKTLVRTTGDIIINYDFQGGAQHPTLAFRTWQANGTWSAATPITGSSGEAEVNRVSLTNPLAVSPSPSTAPAFTFGEAAINLTALNLVPPGECAPFSSAYVKSRASDAFTSAVKDFIAPVGISLNNCGKLTIIKHTNPGGLDQNFTYSTTGGLSPSSFTLNDAGTDTQVYDNLQPATYTVTEDADPFGFAFASLDCVGAGGSESGRTATAVIVAGSDITCTYINDQQLGAIRVSKTSIKGTALAGAHFSVTGPNNFSHELVSGADGTDCVDGLPFGNYSIQETAAPDGYDIDDTSAHQIAVGTNTDCSGSPEVFNATDTPLTDIHITADSQAVGGTQSQITCTDESSANIGDSPSGNVEHAEVTAPDLHPGTYTCVVVVDP
jgi:hypothetical protein